MGTYAGVLLSQFWLLLPITCLASFNWCKRLWGGVGVEEEDRCVLLMVAHLTASDAPPK